MRTKGNHKEVLQRLIVHVASTSDFTELKVSPPLSTWKPLGIIMLVGLGLVFKMKSFSLPQDDLLCIWAHCECVTSKN